MRKKVDVGVNDYLFILFRNFLKLIANFEKGVIQGCVDSSPLMVLTQCRPKFGHFWHTDRKFFLKAPWEPIYTDFEGQKVNCAPKHAIIWLKKFPKDAWGKTTF